MMVEKISRMALGMIPGTALADDPGLTVLSFTRFALATLAGILPASFLLAHFGAELSTGDVTITTIIVVILGILGIAPLLARLATRK